jgi:hypothetical protein
MPVLDSSNPSLPSILLGFYRPWIPQLLVFLPHHGSYKFTVNERVIYRYPGTFSRYEVTMLTSIGQKMDNIYLYTTRTLLLECEATSLSNRFPVFRRYVVFETLGRDYALTRHGFMEKRNHEPHHIEHFVDGWRCHLFCSYWTHPRLYLF